MQKMSAKEVPIERNEEGLVIIRGGANDMVKAVSLNPIYRRTPFLDKF